MGRVRGAFALVVPGTVPLITFGADHSQGEPMGRTARQALVALDTRIHLIRGARVMISVDLAELYGVRPNALIQAVKRNRGRFPADFMFQLTRPEYGRLKSQIVTSNRGGIRRAMPYAFTEQGVAMLSSVLRSPRAVAVNIEIMRAFVRLRRTAGSLTEIGKRFDELERKYDAQFTAVFQAIRDLMSPERSEPRRIGFRTGGRRVGAPRAARS